MKTRLLALAAAVLPLFAGGCASGGGGQIVMERVDLNTLNCAQLQEGTSNWYLVLFVEDEKIVHGTASQLKDTIPKIVTTYKNFEKAFVARCPAESKVELASLHKQYPIKRIQNM
jgi:hypothetical protein